MKKLSLSSLLLMAAAICMMQSCKLPRMDPPCPTIDSLSPNGAKAAETVSIKGAGFLEGKTGLYSVNIGDTSVSVFAVPDKNTLQFKVPQGKGGNVSVHVNETGCTSNAKEFIYYYKATNVELFAGTVGVNNCTTPAQDCFSSPAGIDLDNEGNLIVADKFNHVIRKLTPAGKITFGKFKMTGCDPLIVNDAAFAFFFTPTDVEVDATGDIYVTEEFNSVIRLIKKNATGPMSAQVFAGKCMTSRTNDGNGACSLPTTLIGSPYSLSKNGNTLYFADNGRIRYVSAGCDLSTLKINSATENFKGIEFSTARTGQQMVYIADIGNGVVSGSVKAVDLNGNITTLTTSGSGLNQPNALTLDSKGNIFLTDGATNKIYVLYKNGYLAVLAGSGSPGSMGGDPMTAQFNGPSGLALDEGKKTLFISDTKNYVIRKISFQ